MITTTEQDRKWVLNDGYKKASVMLAFLLSLSGGSIFVLALAGGAVAVQIEAVIGQPDVVLLGDIALALLDHLVGELDHLAAVEADQVVVVFLGGQFEHRFAPFEVVTGNNTGIIKLVENAIYGSETNLFTLVDQSFVQIFRTGVLAVRLLQDFQDFDTGQGDLEPGLF